MVIEKTFLCVCTSKPPHFQNAFFRLKSARRTLLRVPNVGSGRGTGFANARPHAVCNRKRVILYSISPCVPTEGVSCGMPGVFSGIWRQEIDLMGGGGRLDEIYLISYICNTCRAEAAE